MPVLIEMLWPNLISLQEIQLFKNCKLNSEKFIYILAGAHRIELRGTAGAPVVHKLKVHKVHVSVVSLASIPFKTGAQ